MAPSRWATASSSPPSLFEKETSCGYLSPPCRLPETASRRTGRQFRGETAERNYFPRSRSRACHRTGKGDAFEPLALPGRNDALNGGGLGVEFEPSLGGLSHAGPAGQRPVL